MPQNTPILELRGRTLFDSDGEKIGKVDELYCDKEGGQPEWALVSTGLFGTRKTFLPIQRAAQSGDDALVPFAREQVKDAPQIEADRELSEEEERRLYRHYGVPYTSDGTTTAKGSGDAGETSAEDAMTRSEEELRVGTAPRERGRARLRKYVVAENVETTVPVQREEPRVEREPITDENIDQAMSGPEISGGRARGGRARRRAGCRETHRAEGACPSREGHGHRGASGVRRRAQGTDRIGPQRLLTNLAAGEEPVAGSHRSAYRSNDWR